MKTINTMVREIEKEFGSDSRQWTMACEIAKRAGSKFTNARAVVLLCEVISDGRAEQARVRR